MQLTTQVAIVTGGAQGIGRAVAKRLGKDGASVVILDISHDAGEAASREIGGRCLFLKTDCTRKAEVDASVAKAIETFGRIDILVNNIGWALPTFFMEEDEAYWDQLIAVNNKTQLLVTQVVLKDMVQRNSGRIVNIASDAGRVGQMQGVVYSLCKAGVIGFTKALAREVARHQIAVNCICPGPTDTDLFQTALSPRIKETIAQAIPFKRIARPEEIAAAAAFLCSREAAYITGQVLSVSGGLTMAG